MCGWPAQRTMRPMTARRLVPLLAVLGLATAAPAAHAASAADNIGSAPSLTGAGPHTVSYNLVGATGQVGEPPHVNADYTGKTVWVKWTPSLSGGVWLSSCGASRPTGAYLVVYTGGPLFSGLKKITTKEHDCYGGHQIWQATAGTTYWIAIDNSKYAAPGAGTLKIEQETDKPQAQFVAPAKFTGPLATFQLAASGAKEPRFSCWLDGAPVGDSCGGSAFSKFVGHGDHKLEVAATDFFHNTGGKVLHTFNADAKGPTAAFGPPPSSDHAILKPTFTFSAPEDKVTFRCEWDDLFVTKPCTSPYMPPVQVPWGEHKLEVRAYDHYGNEGPEVTLNWSKDAPPPHVPTGTGYVAPAPAPAAAPPLTQPSGTSTATSWSPTNSGPRTPCAAKAVALTRSQRTIRRRGMRVRITGDGRNICVVRLSLKAGRRTVGYVVKTVGPSTSIVAVLRAERGVARSARLRLVNVSS
jgi:hypothetical protein